VDVQHKDSQVPLSLSNNQVPRMGLPQKSTEVRSREKQVGVGQPPHTRLLTGESPEESVKLEWAHAALPPGAPTLPTIDQVPSLIKGRRSASGVAPP
jgi:hypothetical protein